MTNMSEASLLLHDFHSFDVPVLPKLLLAAQLEDGELDCRDQASTCASPMGSNASSLGSDYCASSDDEEEMSSASTTRVEAVPMLQCQGRRYLENGAEAVMGAAGVADGAAVAKALCQANGTRGGLRRVSRCTDLVGMERLAVATEAASAVSAITETSVEAAEEAVVIMKMPIQHENGMKKRGLRRVPRSFDLVGMEQRAACVDW